MGRGGTEDFLEFEGLKFNQAKRKVKEIQAERTAKARPEARGSLAVPRAGGDGKVDREGLVCMKEGGL